MEKRKLLLSVMLLSGLSLFIFSSCSKDDEKPAAPTIEVVHLGSHEAPDEGVFYLGEEGHFEVNIKAPGLIEKIDLEIRQESGYGTFDLKKEYKEDYAGKIEILGFHDHPIVPEGQAIGAYSFHLKVTDQLGQVATLDKDITVEAGDGTGGEHHHDEDHE